MTVNNADKKPQTFILSCHIKMSKTAKKMQVSAKIMKTRRRYTINEKIKILKQLENSNLSAAAFSKKINIPQRTLRDWNLSKSKILSSKKKTTKKMEPVKTQSLIHL